MPTVTIGNNSTDTFSGVIDTELNQSNPTDNRYATNAFGVYKEGSGNHANALIMFPLTSLPDNIVVSAATVHFRIDTNVGAVSHTFTFKRALRDWITALQATWNVWSAGNNWTTAGGLSDGNDRATSPSASAVVTTGSGYKTLDVIAMASVIEGWASGAIPNYGFHVERTDAADDATYKIVSSSEEADTFRPYLTLTYEEPAAPMMGQIVL
jgi:hypothetical protein